MIAPGGVKKCCIRLTIGPIVCLAGVKDPGNLGTIIRTADWFGIKNILLSEQCVDVYNPKVVRSTMGSIFHTAVFRSNNIEKDLQVLKKNSEYKIYSLDLAGENINKMKASNNIIYLFGSESHGVMTGLEKLIDKRYTIPKKGEAESLNLGVAVGVLLSKI